MVILTEEDRRGEERLGVLILHKLKIVTLHRTNNTVKEMPLWIAFDVSKIDL